MKEALGLMTPILGVELGPQDSPSHLPAMAWGLNIKGVSGCQQLAAGLCPGRACSSPLSPLHSHTHIHTHTQTHSHTHKHTDTHTRRWQRWEPAQLRSQCACSPVASPGCLVVPVEVSCHISRNVGEEGRADVDSYVNISHSGLSRAQSNSK